MRFPREESRCLTNLMHLGYANTVNAALNPNNMALPVHPKQFEQCPGPLPGEVCENPLYVGAYEWGGKSGVGRTDRFATMDPLTSRYETGIGFGPATRPSSRIIFPDPFADAWAGGQFDRAQGLADTRLGMDVYRCPSDTGYTGMHCPDFRDSGLTSFDHFGTSYNANIS